MKGSQLGITQPLCASWNPQHVAKHVKESRILFIYLFLIMLYYYACSRGHGKVTPKLELLWQPLPANRYTKYFRSSDAYDRCQCFSSTEQLESIVLLRLVWANLWVVDPKRLLPHSYDKVKGSDVPVCPSERQRGSVRAALLNTASLRKNRMHYRCTTGAPGNTSWLYS